MEQKVGKIKAENVNVTDSGSYFDATNVETILQEIKLKIVDDGTYYIFQIASVKLMKIRKSDNQLLLGAGVDTDETL